MAGKGANVDNKENYIENEFAEMWLEDGIVMQVFKPHVTKLTLEMGKKIVQDRIKVMNEVSHPLFVDTNNAKDMDKSVRDYFVTTESVRNISVAAFLIHNYLTYLGAKLFVSFTNSPVKTEFFKTKSEAIKWLQKYKD